MNNKMTLKKEEAYKILGLDQDCTDSEFHFVKLSEAIYSKVRDPANPDAVKRFQELKQALITINNATPYKNYNLEDMFSKFSSEHIDEDFSDEDYSFEEEEIEKPHLLTAEEASKNARDLIEEVEKEKRRAEKKKASKKRRKQKKKNEKMDSKEKAENASSQPTELAKSNQNHLASSELEEDIDPNSAFVANIAKSKTRKKSNNTQPAQGGNKSNNSSKPAAVPNNNNSGKQGGKGGQSPSRNTRQQQPKENSEAEEDEEIEEMKNESYRLNELGKTLALEERFQEAIALFTKAIELNPTQPSFLDNRSYCYTSLHKFKRALKDAKKAIELDYERPQGYFRMGQAYIGMKDYVKSEEAFHKVLELEPNCPDAHQELYTIKMLQLMDMGITSDQARAALSVNSTVEQATEWIYEGNYPSFPAVDEEEVYISEEEEVEPVERRQPPPAPPPPPPQRSTPNTTPSTTSTSTPVDIKMDPRNPEKLSTLWVGNIGADLQDKALWNLFAKYGTVKSYKVVKDAAKNRNYAFINFKDPESASNAMKALQGKPFGGDNLRLRFPDNTKGAKNNIDNKKQGPIITQYGQECRHFRQGFCTYGTKCIFKHIPSHEGIDKSKH